MYLAAGMLIYLLIDFGAFRQGVKDLTVSEAAEQYFSINLFFLFAGIILGIVIVSLSSIGKIPFLANLGLDVNRSPEAALMIGFLNQWLVIKARKYLKSTVIETQYDKVVIAEKDKK